MPTPNPETFLSWLRTLLPRPCPGCGEQLGRAPGLCAACTAGLRARVETHSPLVPQPGPHLVTLGRYAGPLRRAVRALKYGGAREVAGPLGQALGRGVPPGWGVGGVVPVPLHPSRQRERGYNQAELLAAAVAAELGVPVLPLLERTRATAQQAKKSGAERAENLRGAFRVRPGRVLPGVPLLVVDDVMTTASTLQACRDALLAAAPANAGCELRYAVVAR